MIFTRYIGPDGNGKFTKGKTYIARPGVGSADTVDVDRLTLTDDTGENVCVSPQEERFMFPEEVYAVILQAIDDEFQPGVIVTLDDISKDGKFCSVKSQGYYNADMFELLDRTTVVPGIYVCEQTTGVWTKVERVDECMWIRCEGRQEMESPENFRFAVTDGEMAMEPLMQCIDADGADGLTHHTIYRLTQSDFQGDMVGLVNDDDQNMTYDRNRFRDNF